MSEKQKMTHPRILDHMVVCASCGSELEMDFSKIVGFPSALPRNLVACSAVVVWKLPKYSDSLGKNIFYSAG